jgi:hypothetical protein
VSDGDSDVRTSHQILEEWRELVRTQGAIGDQSPAGIALERQIAAVRREYLERFDAIQDGTAAQRGLVATSDEFIGAVAALRRMVDARAGCDGDGTKLDAEILRLSAEVLRLSELQSRAGDRVPPTIETIDHLAANEEAR